MTGCLLAEFYNNKFKNMKKYNRLYKYHIIPIVLVMLAGIMIWSCNDDDELTPLRDKRLAGKDKLAIIPQNPNTLAEYTDEEIVNIYHNPSVEEQYLDSQAVVVNIWTQLKPLKVEIFKEGESTADTILTESTDLERPDLNIENNGKGYLTVWSTTPEDLKIALLESQLYEIKVTFNNAGVDEWQNPSVLETTFTVHHIEAIPIPDPSPFFIGPFSSGDIKGYWKFDDPTNLLKATVGNDLIIIGDQTVASGVNDEDGAITVEEGSGYTVLHGLEATGGEKVNTYSIIYDVKAPNMHTYVNLMQNNLANDGDGNVYVSPNAGFWLNGITDSGGDLVQDDTWHRIVLTLDGETGIFAIYIDGILVHSVADMSPDSFFAPELAGFNVFLDNNGEDAPITCKEFMFLDVAVTEDQVSAMAPVAQSIVEEITENVAGRWTFDDPTNLLKASNGNDLVLIGDHAVANGVNDKDGAITVEEGSGYSVIHGIGKSGGDKVNTYSIIYDVKAPNMHTYVNLLQNDITNGGDGNVYVNSSAGFWLNGIPNSGGDLVQDDTWHRIVLTLDAETAMFAIYVDGTQVHSVSDMAPDSFFAPLEESFSVFLDNNGEDAPITCTDLTVLDIALSQSQAESLGKITPAN